MRFALWRHFALLLVLACVFLVATTMLTGVAAPAGASPLEHALRELPESLYWMLGVVAGIVVGTARPAGRTVHDAMMVALVATAGMLALSIFAMPDAGLEGPRLVRAFEVGHVLPAALPASYPVDHPRIIASETLRQLGMLALPAILVGVMLGIGAWLDARVRFRYPRDGVVARWMLSWLLVPGMAAVLLNWSMSYGYDILFRGQPAWIVLMPYAPALVVAIIAWRGAARAARNPSDSWAHPAVA